MVILTKMPDPLLKEVYLGYEERRGGLVNWVQFDVLDDGCVSVHSALAYSSLIGILFRLKSGKDYFALAYHTSLEDGTPEAPVFPINKVGNLFIEKFTSCQVLQNFIDFESKLSIKEMEKDGLISRVDQELLWSLLPQQVEDRNMDVDMGEFKNKKAPDALTKALGDAELDLLREEFSWAKDMFSEEDWNISSEELEVAVKLNNPELNDPKYIPSLHAETDRYRKKSGYEPK